jgi:hypothetical protein
MYFFRIITAFAQYFYTFGEEIYDDVSLEVEDSTMVTDLLS